jgi:hypothetical protein
VNPSEIWDRQSLWSQSASRLKRSLQRWRNLVLTLTLLGAVLANAAVIAGLESLAGKVLAALGGFAVAVAGVIRPRGEAKAVQEWTRSRSVAEGIKREVYAYVTRTSEYATGDRDRKLSDAVARLEESAADLEHHLSDLAPKDRVPPGDLTAAEYDAQRVQPEIDYYRVNAGKFRRKIARANQAQLILGLVGAALAAGAAISESEDVAIWVPVVSAFTAAVAAHLGAERYEFQLVEYSRTGQQLRHLSRTASSDPDFVARCEEVISIQNEGWMAKFAEDDDV